MINHRFFAAASFLLLLIINTSYSQQFRVLKGDSVHVALGIPKDNDPSDDYIILRPQYALSYNNDKGIPNWISYELNKNWYGTVSRFRGNFITDTSLPANFNRIRHQDYTNTGFDRGHLVRSQERTKTVEDNKSTFILTNIIPQTPDLNRGPWLGFEYYCEKLCNQDNKQLFVITGPVVGSQYIDTNMRVGKPDSCFKIVVVLDYGQNINHINENTTVIAVMMPNISGIRRNDWKSYIVNVRRIENTTGYDFLDHLPIELQNILEYKIYISGEEIDK